VNEDKTAIMRPRGRQTVTGLVVNARNSRDGQGAPRVSRRDIRRFRAFLHQYETLGREAMTEKMGQDSLAYAARLSFVYSHGFARTGSKDSRCALVAGTLNKLSISSACVSGFWRVCLGLENQEFRGEAT
jgi:hypothetical protein